MSKLIREESSPQVNSTRTRLIEVGAMKFLKEEDNVIAAIPGDDWYCGALQWKNRRKHHGNSPGFLAELALDPSDDIRLMVATGRTFPGVEPDRK